MLTYINVGSELVLEDRNNVKVGNIAYEFTDNRFHVTINKRGYGAYKSLEAAKHRALAEYIESQA